MGNQTQRVNAKLTANDICTYDVIFAFSNPVSLRPYQANMTHNVQMDNFYFLSRWKLRPEFTDLSNHERFRNIVDSSINKKWGIA